MAITVVGSIAIDNIETPFNKVSNVLGGSVSFFSLAACFLTEVRIIGVVGSDFSQNYFEVFKKKSIDISQIKIKEGKTFHWEGKYDYNLSDPKTLNTELGVFSDFQPIIPENFKNDILFLANIDPDIQLNILKQMNSSRLIVLDTMNFWIESKKEKLLKVIENADIFIINSSEARLLTNQASVFSAAKSILNLGPKTLIIKRGECGAAMFTGNKFFIVPAYPLEDIKDPTGAGDSFAGGFLGYIDNTGDISFENFKKALVFGNIMASYTVEDFSVNKLLNISLNDLRNRFNKFKEITHFENIYNEIIK
jgi:sugar/nucleoside kinase (ribokinase family)